MQKNHSKSTAKIQKRNWITSFYFLSFFFGLFVCLFFCQLETIFTRCFTGYTADVDHDITILILNGKYLLKVNSKCSRLIC